MRYFKKIMLGMQGQNKTNLHWLYNEVFTDAMANPNYDSKQKIFNFRSMDFWFQGTGWRSAEKIIMMVALPTPAKKEESVPMTTYLLQRIAPIVQAWNEENKNDHKEREKAKFAVQSAGNRMLRRSGISYDEAKGRYVLKLLFVVPLINGTSVNGKSAARAVSDLLTKIEEQLLTLDKAEAESYVKTYHRQQKIREFLRANGYCAFVANGSILPREKDSDEPMQGAIPFSSPKESEIEIDLGEAEDSGTADKDAGSAARHVIRGMGIPCGITVITGGGYSGKSTLLDALEAGIYDHVPGDGREYVLSDESALKVYAEDGRPVSELDLSAFFKFLPGKPLEAFCTEHASGSVSQASNILEAVGGGSKLLLIDEDKSATNFMIRDHIMRMLVEDEPIIPFTERVKELWKERGVSTILVIGGSSEYLHLADQVILMKDFCPRMITDAVQKLVQTTEEESLPVANWRISRRLLVKETSQPFLYFRTVETENEKKVILDEYSADVTMLTALSTHEQLCTVTVVMERLLTDLEGKNREVLENVNNFLEDLMERGKTGSIMPETQSWFYEEVRPLDALCCINRMRGARFLAK